MFSRYTLELGTQLKFLAPSTVLAHTQTCPSAKPKVVCPGSGGSGSPGGIKLPDFKRAEKSGPVRFGFIPEEWFKFFYPITGVTGPYLFGVNIVNYLLSKEIYILEHEYYLGLSIFPAIYVIVTKFGAAVGASLDKEVDAIKDGWVKGREDEKAYYQSLINAGKDAQARAKGQKILMHAKKENIAMQLEAVYRERMMIVYRAVKGRMDYHVKRVNAENKIQQRWMITWILENVRKSITPEFEKEALNAAIRDLAALANKA